MSKHHTIQNYDNYSNTAKEKTKMVPKNGNNDYF